MNKTIKVSYFNLNITADDKKVSGLNFFCKHTVAPEYHAVMVFGEEAAINSWRDRNGGVDMTAEEIAAIPEPSGASEDRLARLEEKIDQISTKIGV